MEESITGRDNYITALAIFVAIRTLKDLPSPPWPEIQDMQKLLDRQYPKTQATLQLQSDIALARRLGWTMPAGGATSADIRRWIEEHHRSDINTIALFDSSSDAASPADGQQHTSH